MKRLILIIILLTPTITNAQHLKNSRAYAGGIIHDGRPGGMLLLSYGINKYIGIGVGVDLTSYVNKGYSSSNTQSKFFAPFYGDLRFKYMVKTIEPFIMSQFGKPAYTELLTTFTDITGSPRYQLYQSGKLFYGAGAGLSVIREKVGFFAAFTYRIYKFKYSPKDADINGRQIPGPEDKDVVLVSTGLIF